jgi:citrate synthase
MLCLSSYVQTESFFPSLLSSCVVGWGTKGQDLYNSKSVRDKQIVRIIGKVPTLAAAAYLRMAGRQPVLPSNQLSYSENFLYMLDSLGDRSYRPNPRLARVLDILFILHAEHEMNCSTAAARHLASRYLVTSENLYIGTCTH